MRRMNLAILAGTAVLVPFLAHAQSSVQPTTLQAKTNPSPAAGEYAVASLAPSAIKPSPVSASIASANLPRLTTHETILAQFSTPDFTESAMRSAGTLVYGMSSTVTQQSAPKITRTAPVELTEHELAEQPSLSNVVVRANVDENGFARNLSVTRSAGLLVDRRALAAVRQYRFQPAMVDNQPIASVASISIRIEKQ